MWRPMSLFMLVRFLLCVWKVRIPYRKGMSWGMCSLLITTSKKYYIIIFTRTVREAFQRNIRQKQNLNLICFVSFKNQNWEMYCLLQPFWPVTTIVFGIFRLGQISHTISLGSRGIEGGVRENDAYCFVLRMAHFLIFIHNGGIWKGTIQPRLKNGTHFSCYESLPKGYNVQMSNCLTLTWDATSRNGQRQAWWPKCAATHFPRKIKLVAQ